MKIAPFCVFNGEVDAHDATCCANSQQAMVEAANYPDLDADTLVSIAVRSHDGNVGMAADALRILAQAK